MERLKRKIVEESNQLNTFEALENAQKEGKTIANLSETDKHVMKHGGWFLSGTVGVYPNPGEVLGAEVEIRGLKIQIPKKFQGMKDDSILLIDHPNFKYDAKTKTIIDLKESAVRVSPIPKENNWYGTDKNGFPNLKKTGEQSDRYLYRRTDSAYVGLLVRGFFYYGRGVDAYFGPSSRFGVLVK